MARKRNSVATLVCLGALLLTVAVGGLIAVLLQDKSPAPPVTEGEGSAVTQSVQGSDVARQGQLEGVELERENNYDQEEFHYIINGNPVFKNGKSKGTVMLENADTNHCYMQVDYVLDDDGTTVYRSPMLPPGWSVAQDQLYEQLEEGQYSTTALIAIYENEGDDTPLEIFEEYISITVEK